MAVSNAPTKDKWFFFKKALKLGIPYMKKNFEFHLDYDEFDYSNAQKKLNAPYEFEDVLIQILKDGKHVQILADDKTSFTFTKSIVLNHIPFVLSIDTEEQGNQVLQLVLFNQIVFT